MLAGLSTWLSVERARVELERDRERARAEALAEGKALAELELGKALERARLVARVVGVVRGAQRRSCDAVADLMGWREDGSISVRGTVPVRGPRR